MLKVEREQADDTEKYISGNKNFMNLLFTKNVCMFL